tara:strand:+ start:2828 stop:2956 length:129 start_codon:yes stop_codon:yes gene_type:complete
MSGWSGALLGGAIALSVVSLLMGAMSLERIAAELKRMNDRNS